MYGFAISGKMVLGDDVSGNDGPPGVNFYSLETNLLLSGDYNVSSGGPKAFDESTTNNVGVEDIIGRYGAQQQSAAENIDKSEAAISSQAQAALVTLGGQATAPELESALPIEQPHTSEANIDDNEIVPKILQVLYLVNFYQTEIQNETGIEFDFSFIEELDSEELAAIYEGIGDPDQIIKTLFGNYLRSLLSGTTNKVAQISNDVNNQIRGRIGGLLANVNIEIRKEVNDIVFEVADGFIDASGSGSEISAAVYKLAEITTGSIILEIEGSLNSSVNSNIIFPLTSLTTDLLEGRTVRIIDRGVNEIADQLVSTEIDPKDAVNATLAQIPGEIAKAGNDIVDHLNFGEINSMIRSTAYEAIAGIHPNRIVKNLKNGVLAAITDVVADKVAVELSEVANDLLADNLDMAIPIDFGSTAI